MSRYDSDISIIKLTEAVTYSQSIQPIKLHDVGKDVPDGDPTVVSG